MGRRRLVLTLLQLLASNAIGAQVTGRVVGAGGSGIAAVSLELWSGTERLASRAAASDGSFRFLAGSNGTAAALVVRMIGYRPRTVRVHDGQDIVIQLDQIPLILPEVAVASVPCPTHDGADALSLMSHARSRYSRVTDSIGIAAQYWYASGQFPTRGPIGVDTTTPAPLGERGATGAARKNWRTRIEQRGYAFPPTGSSDERYDLWIYPPLESTYAQHFLDDVFLRRNAFQVIPRQGLDTDVVVLRFCGKARSQPYLDGRLTLSFDGDFVEAEWTYRTPNLQEDAGGEVWFAPRAASPEIPVLLALSSRFWRRGRVRGWYQVSEKYLRWKLATADTMPVF